MKMKTYQAVTLDEALDQIRRELGPDAVIVHTKKVRQSSVLKFFKKPLLEVVAAVSPKAPEVAATVPVSKEEASVRDVRYDKVLSEMRELKEMLYEKTKAPHFPKLLSEFEADLKQQGVHTEARFAFVSAIQQHQGDKRVTASALVKSVTAAINTLEIKEPISSKILCFAGPTGVGKTTTIAKWATEEIVQHKRKVGLITTDTFRIGAVEQLRTYATILKVPFEVITRIEDMGAALEKLSSCDRILIDTAGRNYQQQQFVEEVIKISGHEGCTVQLVLSLTSSYADIQKLMTTFEQVGTANLVLTKLDETTQPGHLLNLYYDSPYPIAYVTSGQQVPQDIHRFDQALLRHVLLEEELTYGSSLSTT